MAQKGISDRLWELMNQADDISALLIVSQRSCHWMTDQWPTEFLEDSIRPFGDQLIDTAHAVDSILFDLIPKVKKIHDELDEISIALRQNEKKELEPTAQQG